MCSDKTNYEQIRLFLLDRGLCNDVVGIIIEYSKPTLKELCLDPKSLRKYRKHQQWLKDYDIFCNSRINYHKNYSDCNEDLKVINYYKEFECFKNITKPEERWIERGIVCHRQYPQQYLFKHPKTGELQIDINDTIRSMTEIYNGKKRNCDSWEKVLEFRQNNLHIST